MRKDATRAITTITARSRRKTHPPRRRIERCRAGASTAAAPSAGTVSSLVMASFVSASCRAGPRRRAPSRFAHIRRLSDEDPAASAAGSSSERRGSAVALLLDLGLLAAQFAQVVELRTTHVTARDDLDVVDRRAVHREGALDAHLEADLAHREGLAHAVSGAAENDALEDLDAGAAAFGDVHVHLDGVTGSEGGDVGAERSRVDGVEDLHDLLFLRPPQ